MSNGLLIVCRFPKKFAHKFALIFVLACLGCLAVVVFSEDVEGQAYILPTLLNGNNFGQ